jgi:DMSO reductase anchor subunit/ferredoxin
MTGCPVAAYEKDPLTGIVRHLDDQCFGCQYCTLMCPYDAPQYNVSKGIVRKCDMCSDRLSHGQAPACAEACPSSAIAIRSVPKGELEARLASGFLPGVADPSQTLPTTRYLSRAGLAHFAPVDELRAEPQHAPASLVLMLTSTQLAAGVAFAAALLGPDQPLPGRLVVASAAALGVIASLFHLGRPWLAYRAVLGLRTSWLSREAVALGLFAAVALQAAGQTALGRHDAGTTFARLSAGLGLCGVFCSVMVYTATRRPHWAAAPTAACFGGGTLLLGGMGTLLLRLLAGSPWSPIEQGLVAIVVTTALARLTQAAVALRAPAAPDASPQARRARTLRGPLRPLALSRSLGLCVAGVLGPLLLLGVPSGAARMLTAALCGCGLLLSELCERLLFFAAAPPSRMPGSLK